MVFDNKDIVYIIINLTTIISVFLAFKNKVSNLEKENGQVRQIIFGDRGSLNLVDVKMCEKYRNEIFTAIRRGEQVNEMLLQRIEELHRNILVIMVSLDVKSPNGIKNEKPAKN